MRVAQVSFRARPIIFLKISKQPRRHILHPVHGGLDEPAHERIRHEQSTAAFAAATVFAREYKDHLWVPILSYSAATLIGLSRITENAHWASDVFAGAALGYVTGLQVVRNYHRYAYLKNHKTPVKSVSFDVQFNYDHIEPALVVVFL